ncbi:Pectin acetylesterase 7 [Capsicum annuum]|nr:Pectin acetylesterase 7 [Capsicum annuum]
MVEQRSKQRSERWSQCWSDRRNSSSPPCPGDAVWAAKGLGRLNDISIDEESDLVRTAEDEDDEDDDDEWMMMANLQFFCLLVCSLAIIKTGLCLDGSPPAYHFQSGFGEGVENWIVQLSATNLHFRGARIFEAVMDELLAKGLKNAKNALLAGTSAGGYPTMLYCDHFRSLLPKSKRVKCFADAGHFIHAKNPKQARGFEEVYNALVTLQGSAKALPKACTSKMNPVLCFFPENILQHIKTPIFIAMSAYDSFQSAPEAFADWYFDRKYWYVIDEKDLPTIPK